MRLLRLSQQHKMSLPLVPKRAPSPRPRNGHEIEQEVAERLGDNLERLECMQDELERPQSRGLALNFAAKQRFYESATGTQVEEELRRLAVLLQSLLKDFALLKDSVWH